MRSAKKPRQSKKGDALWEMLESPVIVGDDVGAKLKGMSTIIGEEFTVLKCACDAGFAEAIAEAAQDGGGWVLAGPKGGAVSSITRDITWVYRCRSFTSFGCGAQIKIVYRVATQSLVVLYATGWAHTHVGAILSSTGLPPPMKLIVDRLQAENPTMKWRSAWNVLVEQHGFGMDMCERARTYFYKGAKECRDTHIANLGVSSYGCVEVWTTEHQLFDLLRAHSPTDAAKYVDVAGVIGALVKPDEGVCAVMMSTPKLLLDAWSNKLFGYSAGQMHLDHTHKLLYEQIPFLVASTPDIGQHVHLIMLGPVTHENAELV